MSKKYSVFITAIFCLFIFGFGIAQFILPDKDFSQQENRYLAQFKAPTFETLKSGEFMEDFEDFIVDQFPLRDQWIRLKARCETLLGKQENNGVYLGTDGETLFAQITLLEGEELEKKVGFVNTLAEKLTVPVHFALIPDKSFVWADRLPANAPLVDDGSMIAAAGDLCSDKVNWIDLSGAIAGEDAFYRTDHHWTTMGAYEGYVALMTAMGQPVTLLDSDPTLVADDFYGTTYSSSGAGWVSPDEMHVWVSESDAITVTGYPSGAPVEGELYVEEKLAVKDKYSMFLGGNQPLCVIRNENADGGKLLVIRDSYSDSLAPFLALNYSEVHLFDLRYNRVPISMYTAENGIDEVLVLYSAANFTTDTNLPLMAR